MFVERLVSAHDLIKSDMRASMSRETLNYYFTVKESMDAVSTFDQRPSIAKCLTLRQRRPKTCESVEKVQKYLTIGYAYCSAAEGYSIRNRTENRFLLVLCIAVNLQKNKHSKYPGLANWCYLVTV